MFRSQIPHSQLRETLSLPDRHLGYISARAGKVNCRISVPRQVDGTRKLILAFIQAEWAPGTRTIYANTCEYAALSLEQSAAMATVQLPMTMEARWASQGLFSPTVN